MFELKNKKKEYFINQILKKLDDSEKSVKFEWNNPTFTETRHFYIDDLLSKNDVDKIYEAFPKSGEGFFLEKRSGKKRKPQ